MSETESERTFQDMLVEQFILFCIYFLPCMKNVFWQDILIYLLAFSFTLTLNVLVLHSIFCFCFSRPLPVWTRVSCWSRRDWCQTTTKWRLKSRRRMPSCRNSCRFKHRCYWFMSVIILWVLVSNLCFLSRELNEQREQAREDLKGLEETVVRVWLKVFIPEEAETVWLPILRETG